MKYSYETQGAGTYLVCELEPTDQLDGLTLGMLTNNHIPGVAPVIYTEMNGQQFLKYNISAKISADKFFSGGITKDRALLGFKNILDALCSADDYMIDINCFSLAKEQVFLNVSSCEASLVCIPVVSQEDINTCAGSFFKESLENCGLGQQEKAYADEVLNYLQDASFSVYGLKDLVSDLYSGARKPVMVAKSVPTPPPVSPFDSTVSIDDMPNLAAKPAVPPIPTPPPVGGNAAVPPVKPAVPPVPPKPPVPPTPATPPRPVVTPPPAKPPVAPPAPPIPPRPAVTPPPATPPVAPPPPTNIPKPPVSNGPGFAIPGQSPAGKGTPPPAPAPQKQPKQPKAKDPNKKMSFFGLLANYNKENAELYKQQKAQAKAQKGTQAPPPPTPAPVGAPVGMPGGAPVGGAPVGGGYPMGGGMAQPNVPVQPPRPVVQPVPVQNSFNETTVLSPVMLSGETTVLSAETGPAFAYLVRLKTGEKININKPVFRIGKEKSYVDFFIADNTAISRSHANIHNENGEYFIEDTNSTNHTYVNGQMINSNVKVKLASGDKIKLANEEFTFAKS